MKIGGKKTKHVHLNSSDEEDPVTVSRRPNGYHFTISPKREAHDYRSGPYGTEQQAWNATQKFIREHWAPIP